MFKRIPIATCTLALSVFLCSTGYGQAVKKTAPAKPAAKPVPASSKKAVAAAPLATPQEIEAGKLLITKSDCLTCHKVSEKLIGPSYADVAAKYPPTDSTVTLLAGKVLKGGSGTWGQLPMTPHPNMSQDDAQKIIKYILSLKAK